MQSKVYVSRSNCAFLSPTRENGSGSRTEKARFGRGINQRSAEINSDRTPLRAYRF